MGGTQLTAQIEIPELILGPIKYPIGIAYQVLAPSYLATIVDDAIITVGPRSTERCVTLSDGQRLIISERQNPKLVDDIDGILKPGNDGGYRWVTHRRKLDAEAKVAFLGLKEYSKRVAAGWRSAFTYKSQTLDADGVPVPSSGGLRPPQLGALFAIGSHWSLHQHPATIVMPTGTGKTETMLSALAAFPCAPVIVAVPTKALRNQTMRKFATFGLLRTLGVLSADQPNPVVGLIRKQPSSEADLAIFEDCNVTVGVIQSLTGGKAGDLSGAIAARASALIVDEAHHIAARSWTGFRAAFATKRVIQFTATPFRNDGQLVDGDVIFSYSLRKAQEDGYFKPIKFQPVHELSNDAADLAIADEACRQLRADLESGFDHLMMARCASISRAEAMLEFYRQLAPEFNPQIIHSELKDSDQRVERLINGTSRIVVCVNMLGEGFDLPTLKIAALHDPHKSLATVLQFTGRFTRTASKPIGNATVIANIADPDVSAALERLYSEDSDWNTLLSEMSSQAAKDHAQLIEFLNAAQSLGEPRQDAPSVSHHLLRPTLSTLVFQCPAFAPKKFFEGLSDDLDVVRVWLNEKTSTLFFVTRHEERVKWTRSKEIVNEDWNLFVLHFDADKQLLYLASTDKSSSHDALAKAVGAEGQISGETIFKVLGRIGRLVFNNLGVTKHGRKNLSYAMYTGENVREALSLSEKAGSRKANLSGNGWEFGKQITIGCSYKGRIWSREAGTLPRFIEWASNIGGKLIDPTINTSDIIDNVLIPEEVTSFPNAEILGLEWPVELLRLAEERISLQVGDTETPLYLCDIQFVRLERGDGDLYFNLIDTMNAVIGEFVLHVGGERGFYVKQVSDNSVTIKVGPRESSVEAFFSDYPPLVRFVDLSELDGNLLLKPQNPYEFALPAAMFEAWDWNGVDVTKESLWREGSIHTNTVQWVAAQRFIDAEFDLVFDDDAPGEAADLICMKEEEDHIRLVLIHCKFSGGAQAGARVGDVVEVASQAVRSAKWAGRFKELCRHVINRNERRKSNARPSLALRGSPLDANKLSKAARFKEIRPEILLVQPGVSISNLAKDQKIVLAAAAAYLKETVGVDLSVICSE